MKRALPRDDAHKNRKFTEGDYDAYVSHRIVQWRFRTGAGFPLYPFAVEETVRHNPFIFTERFCRYMFICILLDGRLVYRSGERTFLLEPGKALLIPPGSDYSFSPGAGAGYHKVVLELKGTLLDSLCSALGLGDIRLVALDDAAGLIATIRRMGGWIEARDRSRIPELVGRAYGILAQLAEGARQRADDGPSRLLAEAQALLAGHLDREFDFAALPERLRTSATTLNRLFREKLNISPRRYRNVCRIEYARELLTNSRLSIKEIAFKCGYCNQFYFCAEFARFTGYTPTAFRRELDGGDAPPTSQDGRRYV